MLVNKFIDHTLLKAFATKSDIDKLCEEAKKYDFKSVCVNPCRIRQAKEALKDSDVLVCTVIGFPLGAMTAKAKGFEALTAVNDGADEIDMVINIGKAKEHDYDFIEKEIAIVVASSAGRCVKVILETCYLTDEEIVECCKAAVRAHATFVKTSTGFGTSGATPEVVKLMRDTVGDELGVKAAGGVRNMEDLEKMVASGATRIGTSCGVAIMQNQVSSESY